MNWKNNICILQKCRIIKYKFYLHRYLFMLYAAVMIILMFGICRMGSNLKYCREEMLFISKHMMGYMSAFLLLPQMDEKYDAEWGQFYSGLRYHAWGEIILMLFIHFSLLLFEILILDKYLIIRTKDVLKICFYNIGYALGGIGIMKMTKNVFGTYSLLLLFMLIKIVA